MAAKGAVRRSRACDFVSMPEPRSIGQFARGRQICAGNVLFAGHLVELGEGSLWDTPPPDRAFDEAMHGFVWLDDLAAVGDGKARTLARDWIRDWITRYGRGTGPGWTPDLAGRRLIRWITHASFVLRGADKSGAERIAFFGTLSAHVRFLARRWSAARPGIGRFEAAAGLVIGGLTLTDHRDLAAPGIEALATMCDRDIGQDGGIATRNPEELLEVLTLLNWTIEVMQTAGVRIPAQVSGAVQRIVPALRALRHADGSLARFHGGGRGQEGRLDAALAASKVRDRPDPRTLYMGFVRASAGRTSLIVDAAAPPAGPASADAHASTLGYELTSGRRPLVVNCGSGARFGKAWRRAGRATPSHSVLGIDGFSSSRLSAPRRRGDAAEEWLADVPTEIGVQIHRFEEGTKIELGHDGYRQGFGLTYARTLELTFDGRSIAGEEVLTTQTAADEDRFDKALDDTSLQGIPYSIRFHLHPEVDAELDLGGRAISLVLRSGEIWVMRHDGAAGLTLEPSVFLERGRLRPRAAQQMVLSGRALSYATRVRWSLAKAHDTPYAWRDLVEDDPFEEAQAEEAEEI